jgi:hypothetical protein
LFYKKRVGAFLAFFLILLLVGAESAVAQGTTCYRLLEREGKPVRWPIGKVQEITFWIDDSVPEEWHKAIQLAAASWNIELRALNIDLRFKLTPDPESPNIISTAYHPKYIAWAPLEAVESGGVFYIKKAEMLFNTGKYEFTTKDESGKFDVQGIATHGFGHWLGLGDVPRVIEWLRCRDRTVMLWFTVLDV